MPIQCLQRGSRIVFVQPRQCIRIGDAAVHAMAPSRRQRQYQHVGRVAVEAVEVALPAGMPDHVARNDAMQPGIASLFITAAQDHGDERLAMQVTGQALALGMAKAPGGHLAQAIGATGVNCVQAIPRQGL